MNEMRKLMETLDRIEESSERELYYVEAISHPVNYRKKSGALSVDTLKALLADARQGGMEWSEETDFMLLGELLDSWKYASAELKSKGVYSSEASEDEGAYAIATTPEAAEEAVDSMMSEFEGEPDYWEGDDGEIYV